MVYLTGVRAINGSSNVRLFYRFNVWQRLFVDFSMMIFNLKKSSGYLSLLSFDLKSYRIHIVESGCLSTAYVYSTYRCTLVYSTVQYCTLYRERGLNLAIYTFFFSWSSNDDYLYTRICSSSSCINRKGNQSPYVESCTCSSFFFFFLFKRAKSKRALMRSNHWIVS